MTTDMDQQLFQRLLSLAAKTGDRFIVVDPATDRPFVVMPMAQYESLVLGGRMVTAPGPMPVAPPVMPVEPSPSFTATPLVEGLDLGALARESDRIEASVGVSAFTPEPTVAALPDDERFYVEPLE